MKRCCLALDLKNDESLIKEYKVHHQAVWPEVKASILDLGVHTMEIYAIGNRLFMIMEVEDSFTFERKAAADASNAKVQQWETLMGNYQVALPQAIRGEKWALMDRIFSLNAP
jgi:L-rhamnose mutarotase